MCEQTLAGVEEDVKHHRGTVHGQTDSRVVVSWLNLETKCGAEVSKNLLREFWGGWWTLPRRLDGDREGHSGSQMLSTTSLKNKGVQQGIRSPCNNGYRIYQGWYKYPW